MENITILGAILLLVNIYLFSAVLETHFSKKKISISALSAFALTIVFAFTSFNALNEYTYKINGIITNAKILDRTKNFGGYFSPSTTYNVTYSFKDKSGFAHKSTISIQANQMNTSSALNDKMKIQYIYGTPLKNRIDSANLFVKYINFSIAALIGILFCLYRKNIGHFHVNSYLEIAAKLKAKH